MAGSVLIIDADALFAGQAQAAFEAAGLAVAVRDDAPIDVIRRLRPAVLMVNVELPKASGYSVCNRLRRDKELSLIPILLTSAEASGEAFKRHSTTSDRADDYASKPLDTGELMGRIKKLLALSAERHVPAGALEGVAPPATPAPPPTSSDGTSGPIPVGPVPIARPRPPPPGAPPSLPKMPPVASPPVSSGGHALPPPPPISGVMPPIPPPTPLPLAPPTGAQPPPIERSSTSAATPPALPSMAPPPLRKAGPSLVPPPLVSPDEGTWRAIGFDDMIKERVTGAAPVAPPKVASADQVQTFLRAYGKFLETKEKAAREGWDGVQEQAKDLDRRLISTRYELAQREARVVELTAELERTQAQLKSVETELKTFQGEITRIFEEKDAEEKETVLRLNQLEESNTALTRDLAEAKKQNDADRTRLKLFKQDLDDLQAEGAKVSAALQAANDRGHRGDESLRQAERQIQALEARVTGAETMLVERAEELEEAQEKLDRVVIDAQNEQRRLTEGHDAQLGERETELLQQIQDLEGTELQLRGDIDALEIARGELDSALIKAIEERDHLARVKAELTTALDEQEIQAQERQNRLEAEIEELEREAGGQGSQVAELTAARDELDRALRQTQDELLKEQATWITREAELNEAVNELEAEIIDLEQQQGAGVKRITELEAQLTATQADMSGGQEELEEVRSNLFERIAELDATRSNAQNLQRQVELMRAELASEKQKVTDVDANVRAAERDRESLDRQLAELRQNLLDLEAAKSAAEDAERDALSVADELRKKLDRSESFVARAKEKIAELQKTHTDATADVRREAEAQVTRERDARKELEEQLTAVEGELSRREQEAAEATRRLVELDQELGDVEQRHASELATRDTAIAERDVEIDELRTAQFESQRLGESSEERIAALITDLELREKTAQTLRSELSQRDGRISEIDLSLVKARDQLRANAELSRERERRDKLLGRVMAVLDGVQSSLSGWNGVVAASDKQPSLPPLDVLNVLGSTPDAATRDVSAAWPIPAPSIAPPPLPSSARSGPPPVRVSSPPARPPGSGSNRPSGGPTRISVTPVRRPSAPAPAPPSAPAASPSPKPKVDDETTAEGLLQSKPALMNRGPFPGIMPLVPTAPIRPDALTPGTDASLFGALIQEIQTENNTGQPQQPRPGRPARRVDLPTRGDSPRGSKRKNKHPKPGADLGEQLDEAAMLIDSSMPDDATSPGPRMDPFRTSTEGLPDPQTPSPPPLPDPPELDEREVTEIIRIDQLK